jgi:hypothetical protein
MYRNIYTERHVRAIHGLTGVLCPVKCRVSVTPNNTNNHGNQETYQGGDSTCSIQQDSHRSIMDTVLRYISKSN